LSSSIRLGAFAKGVALNARDAGASWSRKGRDRLAAVSAGRASTAPPSMTTFPRSPPTRRTGVVFGRPLAEVVRATRIEQAGDEVGVDERLRMRIEARPHLPAIAWRCLEYLDEWGTTEEGVYRCVAVGLVSDG
jgi:hypothetical protein